MQARRGSAARERRATLHAKLDGVRCGCAALRAKDHRASEWLAQPARAAPLYWTWPGTGVPPLPAGWTAHQTRDGRIAHQSPDGRVVEYRAPKGASGYSVRIGEWKGVVAHCADNETLTPSSADIFEVYHLPSDPFEQNNLASTDQGKAQFKALQAVIAGTNVSCRCFQC